MAFANRAACGPGIRTGADPISYNPRCSVPNAIDLNGNDMQKSAGGFIGAMLFLAPFGIAGLIAAGAAWGRAVEWVQIQSWQKVPATVETVGILRNGQKKTNQRQSGRVEASYSYEYEDKSYTSHRVALFEFSDNIGSAQEDNLEYLQSILKKKHATHCYVNPESPPDAILIAHPRWELFTFIGLIAGLMGTIGVVGQITLVRNLREARSADAEMALSPDTPWTWPPRWSDGYIRSDQRENLHFRTWWLVWIILSVFPALVFSVYGLAQGDLMAVTGCAFALIPAWLGRDVLRRRAFLRDAGDVSLSVGDLPLQIDSDIVATLRLPEATHLEKPIRYELVCDVKQRMKNKHGRRTQTVYQHSGYSQPGDTDSNGLRAEIELVIPSGYRTSDPIGEDVIWKLKTTISFNGSDHRVEFRLPVFQGTTN